MQALSEIHKSHVSDEESLNLTPLQHMQQTAKQVAQSTGEAVDRLTSKAAQSKQDQLANHGDEGESLTPLQRAQLTAKKVARSTGEAVERLGSKIDQNHQAPGEGIKLPSKSSATRSYHHTTPKRQVAPDTRKLENVEHNSSLSPLQRAELTAQRVARSTGKSLEKLSKSEHVLHQFPHSVPLHEQNGERESTNESTAESESDRSDSECPTTSETRLATPVQGDPVDNDHLSSLEKVKRTAEMVADSTGVAVQKLSNSLSDSI